jgi:hypothetical protein
MSSTGMKNYAQSKQKRRRSNPANNSSPNNNFQQEQVHATLAWLNIWVTMILNFSDFKFEFEQGPML